MNDPSSPDRTVPPVATKRQKELNIIALLSMIFGIVGIMMNGFSLVAAIMGYIALRQIKNDPDAYTGREFAIAGLVLGVAKIVISLIILIMVIVFYLFFILLAFGTLWI